VELLQQIKSAISQFFIKTPNIYLIVNKERKKSNFVGDSKNKNYE